MFQSHLLFSGSQSLRIKIGKKESHLFHSCESGMNWIVLRRKYLVYILSGDYGLNAELTGGWGWLSSASHAELKPVAELETAESREFLQVGSALVQALLQCVSVRTDGQSQSGGAKWIHHIGAEAVHVTALSCWAVTCSSTRSWP